MIDKVMIVFVGVSIVGSLLLGLRHQARPAPRRQPALAAGPEGAGRRTPPGWKVDQWGNRYYSGPRVEATDAYRVGFTAGKEESESLRRLHAALTARKDGDLTAWANLDPTGHYVDAEPYKELLRLCELLISVNGPDDEDLILEIVAMVAIIHATEDS